MDNDTSYACSKLCAEIDAFISALDGFRLHRGVDDPEALEIAMFDLENAKAMILLALTGKEKAH